MTRVRHEVVGADSVVIAPASSRHPCGPCSPRWGTRRRRRRETPRRMVRPTVGRRRGVTPSTVDREQRSIAYLWKRSGETCFYTTIFPCTVRPPSPSSTVPLSSPLSTRFVVRLPSGPLSLLHGHLTSSHPRRAQEDRPELPSLRPPFVRSHLSVVGSVPSFFMRLDWKDSS